MSENHLLFDEERNMAGKAITETYKGILRVANNLNLIEGKTDEFLSSTYYLSPGDTTLYSNGLNETKSFLQKGEENKRFSSSDKYTTLKLPVTDSMGNYLNFSLGASSSLVGSYEHIGLLKNCKVQFDENDTETFPIISSPSAIKVGLSERIKEDSKIENGGVLSLDKDAKIAIKNSYQINGNDINEIIDENIRTIIGVDDAPRHLDTFIYQQESYKKDNNNRDCFVGLQNLKEYVTERVNAFFDANKAELPPATIVSQYCSLDKWFCLDENNNVNDETLWEGYRPAMYAVGNTKYAPQNIIQNQAFKHNAYLYLDGASTGEFVSDFKRGYALCNGDSLTLKLCPSYIQNSESMQDSIRLFFDLFYFIGYYYSQDSKAPRIKRVEKINNNYRFIKNDEGELNLKDYIIKGIDNEFVYGSTMATILAFKAMERKFKSDKNFAQTPEEVIEWLKNEKIPDEYVFNFIVPNTHTAHVSCKSFKYSSYLEPDVDYRIRIGTEINKFSDSVFCYIYDRNTKEYYTEYVPIWKMAEVYHFAELFLKNTEVNDWLPFKYSFALPELFTTTDSSANLALSKNKNGNFDSPEVFTLGKFVGSNGIVIGDNLQLRSGIARTENLNQSALTYNSYYAMSEGLIPHTHYIAKGRDYLEVSTKTSSYFRKAKERFNPQTYSSKDHNTPIEPDLNMSYVSGDKRLVSGYHSGRVALDTLLSGVDAIAGDYKSSPYKQSSTANITSDPQLNYVLQPNTQAELRTVSNLVNGLPPANEYYMPDRDTDRGADDFFTWYGRTSEPIWSETANSSSSEKYNNNALGYFRPESVKVLPLIKL